MSRTRIKICGLTAPEAAEVAARAGADAIGLVFATRSPRSVDDRRAAEIAAAVRPFISVVGVFDPAPAPAGATRLLGRGGWCQVHGSADERAIAELATRQRVVRGFRFDADAVRRWNACPGVAALLVDGSEGGAGTAFDHAALHAMRGEIDRPVILAGGLTPDNVADAIRAVRPYGVDVSSGVESAPGIKEPSLIEAFCAAVRAADEG